jgi:hypothetical protein
VGGGGGVDASVAGDFWRCRALSGAASGTSHLPLSLCSRLPSSSSPSPRQSHARLWRWQKKALDVQRTKQREGQNMTSHAGIMTEKEPASFLRWGMSLISSSSRRRRRRAEGQHPLTNKQKLPTLCGGRDPSAGKESQLLQSQP